MQKERGRFRVSGKCRCMHRMGTNIVRILSLGSKILNNVNLLLVRLRLVSSVSSFWRSLNRTFMWLPMQQSPFYLLFHVFSFRNSTCTIEQIFLIRDGTHCCQFIAYPSWTQSGWSCPRVQCFDQCVFCYLQCFSDHIGTAFQWEYWKGGAQYSKYLWLCFVLSI